IVGVKGGAVLSLPEAADQGSDFLQTDLASRAQAEILQNQRFAQGSIMSLYPDLEVECTYTSLINGFSCKLPESIIPEVESSPYVDYVEQTRSTSVPDMNKAASMSGADLFLEDTGYAGEGMVIAVLDTELEITHPMFAPLPDDTKVKLTKQDIIDAVNSKSLSIDVDPEKAYVSSKLPFVVNYADSKEHRYDTADEDYYHGTHVCGIAAGNKVSYDDAGEISGVASDSQLIFFKIAGSYEDTGVRSMDNDLILAAMEDSVKLGADVINCSFGGDEEILQDDPQEIAYESAENAGVIICAAAGNEADSVYREGMCTPENVDRSTVASPSSAVGNVSVASADNSGVSGGYFALAESRDIIRYKDDTVAEHGFEKLLSEEELEYVSCGLGRPEDLQGKDLSGKLALIDRGELPFYEKVANAEEVGAAGVIFVSDSDDESLEIYVGEGVPCCIVTKSDGEKLKNAGVQKITAANQEEYADRVAMSTFSSRGTNETLRLKPDITGIGGSVISAGYNNSFEEMSGTSMATPYASGCFALTLGYLENNGFELKGAQRVNFVKNLLMNSAKPISGANAYVSPRLQGAGLISLSNMLNTKAVMTSPETNMANVELYDMLPDSFSFDVDLTSISNEDVSFGKCELFVTTDSVQYSMSVDDNILGEDVPVKCSYEISGLDTVAAGEVSHGKVTVTIDPAEVQQLRKLFPNGYFIEGFVQLSGSSNCSDISIPFMGFSSDWVNIPIFDRDYTDPDK
ncbi:MAG: S8 family serine peptidase, partial [Ruminococcus sp.]|nr:S8 family serine peptidase [Ruminococcus sp.]